MSTKTYRSNHFGIASLRPRLGLWDVVLMSPPCSTFSRARFNFRKGSPRPLRDCVYPHGFPCLRESDRAAVRQADFFVDRCLDAIQLQIHSCKHFLIEHPEDLGVTRTGAHPASIWQLSRLRNLIEASASTFALHQCHFGSASQKPTRLADNLPSWAHMRLPGPSLIAQVIIPARFLSAPSVNVNP